MKLKVAIQMDHVSTIDIDGDSTFVLGLEAEERGYEVWHYTPPELIFRDRKVLARAQPMKLRREKGNHFTLGEAETIDLSTFDVVMLRQDPPFDMSYITTTHLLEHIHPRTLVVNDPASVRNAPEKLFVTHFDKVMPPTLITADARALREFWKEHGDIILKPLFGNGGAGVFRVRPDDENFASLLEMFSQRSREPVIAQRYLPDVRQGDNRIILVAGQAAGVVNRVPAGDEEKVRQSLLKGENPNQNDSSGRPLLMIAVMDGQVAVVQTLLKGGAVVDALDRDSYTSLLRAAEKGDVDIADLLLKRNAKPSAQTRQG